jgi:hypothetical protein
VATAMVTQQSERAAIPRSFYEALKQGWRIVAEKSKSVRGSRCGAVMLAKNGRRISVPYFADSDGYRFGFVKAL